MNLQDDTSRRVLLSLAVLIVAGGIAPALVSSAFGRLPVRLTRGPYFNPTTHPADSLTDLSSGASALDSGATGGNTYSVRGSGGVGPGSTEVVN